MPAPLIPLTDWLADFDRGRHSFRQQFGQAPRAWARKRFGFSPLLPQVLRNYGYRIALHIALDDGTYPDAENSKLTWEGNDGTAIDALSRIPIAIDSAAAFLQLPQRIAESMQEDMVAAVVFARWPEVREPWLADFQRMHRYGSVFGRFVTIDEFAEDSGDSGHCAKYEAREYLTPFLIQGSALGQPRPVSRFSLRTQQRADADAARACAAVASLIAPDADLQNQSRSLHELLLAVDEAEPVTDQTRQATTKLQTQAMTRMAERCGADTSAADGVLVFNPLSFARRIPVSIPRPGKEADTTLVEVPGLGFAWTTGETSAQPKLKVPLATTELMHNGIYEIHLNPKTGGIGSIKGFGRSPNRLSQQVAFRFERPQPAGVDEDGDAVTSSYSRMECRDVRVLCSDQTTGQVETTGDLVSPTDGERLASFRQTMTVVRSSPNLDIEIELTDIAELPSGNPWLCYYGCRFAWDDAAAALTRSVFGQAQGFAGERFESPHYFEIASAEERTTIVSHGLPFYRRTDLRMADCLMVVESEQQRRFRYSVVLDQPYPLRAALDCMTPALTTSCGPPAAGG